MQVVHLPDHPLAEWILLPPHYSPTCCLDDWSAVPLLYAFKSSVVPFDTKATSITTVTVTSKVNVIQSKSQNPPWDMAVKCVTQPMPAYLYHHGKQHSKLSINENPGIQQRPSRPRTPGSNSERRLSDFTAHVCLFFELRYYILTIFRQRVNSGLQSLSRHRWCR